MELKNIFDTHAHYDDPRFADDLDQVFEEVRAAGVEFVTNIGADLASSIRSVDLAHTHDFIYATVGIHPHAAKDWDESYYEKLKALAKKDKVVAIGEIGLDYYYDHSPREVQKEVFKIQLRLAQELDMPIVIHMRDATFETIDILRKTSARGIMHSFTGSDHTARELLEMGFYLSYNGVVTFKNARMPLEALGATPLDRILLETDAPYLTPEPYRGKRNDSTKLHEIAVKIAEVKGVCVQELIDITTKNAKNVYKLP